MKSPEYKRSRYLFTYWNEENRFVLYNYNRQTKAVVSKDLITVIDALSDWRNLQQLSDELHIDRKNLFKALEHLTKLKIICKNRERGEDNRRDMIAAWDPIDLAMQRQRSYGGRFAMSERVGKSPSPVKHVTGLSSFKLYKPQETDHDKLSLKEVLEKRKSIRAYSNKHISAADLSYILYHSARIKNIFNSKEGTLTERPYPSGGARYPLEIYVVNNRIRDIQKGIHYYDPLKHQLILQNKNIKYQKQFNKFLFDVQYPLMDRAPDIVLIITAVFARTMWKYEKLGMSLILSDLGCLYQTMYLLATEMKLAPCPIGKTEENLVKNWLNLDWLVESHVGTFLLGKPK